MYIFHCFNLEILVVTELCKQLCVYVYLCLSALDCIMLPKFWLKVTEPWRMSTRKLRGHRNYTHFHNGPFPSAQLLIPFSTCPHKNSSHPHSIPSVLVQMPVHRIDYNSSVSKSVLDFLLSWEWLLKEVAGGYFFAAEGAALAKLQESPSICLWGLPHDFFPFLWESQNIWMAPWKNRTYISFFCPSLNGLLFPMFCLLVEGECRILVF